MTTGAGKPFKIYTPFWRALSAAACRRPRRSPRLRDVPAPSTLAEERHARPTGSCCRPSRIGPRASRRLDAGRGGRARTARRFRRPRSRDYDSARNLPSDEGTSRLSPHLHFGEISPRQVWHRVAGDGRPDDLPRRDRLARLCAERHRCNCPDYGREERPRRSSMRCRGARASGATPICAPGSRAAPAIRSSMPACASSGRPAGCTTACG